MALGLKFTFFGNDKFVNSMHKSPNVIGDAMESVLNKIAIFIQGKSKTYAPVRTGVLRTSIHKSGILKAGKRLAIEVGTNVYYAPFQEFGTSRGVRPKLYMTKATQDAERELPKEMKDMGSKITTNLATK